MASSRYANQTETENDIPLPFHDNQSTSTTKPRSQSDMDIISISLAAIQIFCPMLQSFKKSVEIARREEYAREFLMHVRKLEALRIDLLATTEGFRCYKDCLHKLTDGSQAEAKMVRQCLEEMQTHLENCRAMITKYAPENGQSSKFTAKWRSILKRKYTSRNDDIPASSHLTTPEESSEEDRMRLMTPSDTVKQPFKVRLEWAWKEQAKFRAEYALLQDKLRILKDILDSLAHTKKSNTRYWMEFNEEEGRLKLDQDQVTKTQKALTEVHKGLIDAPYQISSLSVNTKYSLKLFDEQGPALRNHWKFSTAELAAMNICDTSFLFVIQSHEPESENVSEPLLVEAIQEANDTPRTTNRAPGSGGELGSGSNNSSPGRPQHNGAQPGWLPIGTLPNYPHRVFRSKSASTIESMKLNELLRIQQYSKYRQEHFNIALQVILCHLYLMDVFSEAGWPSSASNYTLYSPPQARAEYKSSALKCIFVNCGFGNVEMGTYQSSTAIFETGGAASATSDSRVMRLALLIYGIVHWEDREGDTPFNTEPNDSQSLADLKRTLRKLVHGKATARNPKPFYFGDVFSEFLTWDSQSSLTETQLLIKFAQIISRFGNLYLASEG